MKVNIAKGVLAGLVMTAVTFTTVTTGVIIPSMVVQADNGDYETVNGRFDFGRGAASISIRGNEGQSIVGKRFEIFRIFDAENSVHGESINYTFNPYYEKAVKTVVAKAVNKRDNTNISPDDVTEYIAVDYIQSLNNNEVEGCNTEQKNEGTYSNFRYFVEDLRTEIKDEKLSGDIVYVDSMTKYESAELTGLEYGYYVVDEISTHDSKGYQWYASSLCLVNTANPNATINVKSDYPTLTKKVQEDDTSTDLSEDRWNDIGDFEIGQTVPFKYESTIPNINGYHKYYYAWHDSMDEELTFHDSKDEISIVISDGTSEYKIADDEYNVITNKDDLDALDTFKIEIQDIKKIVDKHFDKTDNLGQNDYSNIKVKLEYCATLNDKAANMTGRPGIENDARLEYSNDPDANGEGKTGYTPWDTVVCFTFKLNGLKTNVYNKVLPNAKFRLYYDSDCTKEVYVKDKEGDKKVFEDLTGKDTDKNKDTDRNKDTSTGSNSNETTGSSTSNDSNLTITDTTRLTKMTKTSDGVTPEEVTVPSEDTKNDKTEGEEAEDNRYKDRVGLSENLQNADDTDIIGGNGYVVINRDSVTGNKAPEKAVEMVSDINGNFTIYGLDSGTYYLKEVEAPAGYRLLKDPITISVKAIYTPDRDSYVAGSGAGDDVLKDIEATGHIKEFFRGNTRVGDAIFETDADNGSFNVKILNEVGSKLPVTGSSLSVILLITGVLLIAASMSTVVKKKSER